MSKGVREICIAPMNQQPLNVLDLLMSDPRPLLCKLLFVVMVMVFINILFFNYKVENVIEGGGGSFSKQVLNLQ